MKIIYLIILCSCLFKEIRADTVKLDLAVLYDYGPGCPGCHDFILNALVPNYDSLKDYMNLKLVPFGNAVITDGNIECQHGPEECQGNRLQSCVFNTIPNDQDLQLHFTECLFNKDTSDPVESGKACAQEHNIPWDPVQSCYDGQLGTDLQLEAGKLANSYNNRKWVPWILYNDISDKIMQKSFLDDFVNTFCRLINNGAPVCNN